ncbi:MAG: PTS sugar transporter subunit IIA [Melioribacteraceae bacterium]|nr:PTS sugar transporter subunit IIA [Melioribacteraceae bacterium]
MKICDILKRENIITDLTTENKTSVINKMIDEFQGDERINNLEIVRESVLEREKIMSTGVGNGFAIPHAKTAGVNGMIAGFCRLDNPIDFESLDGKPVNLVLLLVGEENKVGDHIKMLSRISRLMNKEGFKNRLETAQSVDEIYSVFEEEEKNFLEIS